MKKLVNIRYFKITKLSFISFEMLIYTCLCKPKKQILGYRPNLRLSRFNVCEYWYLNYIN